MVPNRSRFDDSHVGVLLTDGGDVVSIGGGNVLGSSFRVIAGDSPGSSFIGVGGCVFTNFHSYGDSIGRGSVGSGVGSA